jgi:hypothetical protein
MDPYSERTFQLESELPVSELEMPIRWKRAYDHNQTFKKVTASSRILREVTIYF